MKNPFYITGLYETDGSFYVVIERSGKGFRIKPKVTFTQHAQSNNLNYIIKEYFGCGRVVATGEIYYTIIDSLKDINNIILAHFDKYPLQSDKLINYYIFRYIVKLMNKKEHLNDRGLTLILHLIFNMNVLVHNRKLTKKLIFSTLNIDMNLSKLESEKFIKSIYSEKIEFKFNPEYIIGLIDGDGGVHIEFKSKPISFKPYFTLGQLHQTERGRLFLLAIQKYFNCGKIYKIKSNYSRYSVQDIVSLNETIIPFLDKYKLQSNAKYKQFLIFKSVCELIKNKVHLTKLGKLQIVELAYNMNMEGKRRRICKLQYLKAISEMKV